MSNKRLIKEVSGTSVSVLQLTNVFSADFDLYELELFFTESTDVDNIDLRFINSSGNAILTTKYDYAHEDMNAYSSFSENKTEGSQQYDNIAISHTNSTTNGAACAYIFNPFSSSSYTSIISSSSNYFNASYRRRQNIGALKQTNSCTGIELRTNLVGSLSSITARVYGIRVDS